MYAQKSLSEAWAMACLTSHNSKITVLYKLIKEIQTPDELRKHYEIDLTEQQRALITQSIGIFGPCKNEYRTKYKALRHIQLKYQREKRAYKQARSLQRLLGEGSTTEISLSTVAPIE